MSEASEEQASRTVPSDEELLARVQKKDYDAVGVLFDRYARLFLGTAYRILRDRGEAEDMVQEIFLRLCQKSNSFDPAKGSARTWLVQFAYRRSFDRRSYLTRRFFYGGTEIEGLKNTLQEATDLEDQIAARLTGEQLREALLELNDKQSATLQLFFFEGCELREVAERLGGCPQSICSKTRLRVPIPCGLSPVPYTIVSLILKEKRQLNRQQIEKLSHSFHASPAVFF